QCVTLPSTALLCTYFFYYSPPRPHLLSFPTRRSSDLALLQQSSGAAASLKQLISTAAVAHVQIYPIDVRGLEAPDGSDRSFGARSEEHTSELQSPCNLVCRLLLEKKKLSQSVRHRFEL